MEEEEEGDHPPDLDDFIPTTELRLLLGEVQTSKQPTETFRPRIFSSELSSG